MRDMSTSFFKKITTKNTWNLDIIDRFNSLTTEKKNNVFDTAPDALEDSVKVFSTRVDDLTENTNKLLSTLTKKPKTQKIERKRKQKTDFFLEKTTNEYTPVSFSEYKYQVNKLGRAFTNRKFLFEITKGYNKSSANLFGEESNLLMTTSQLKLDDIDFTKPLAPFNEVNTENTYVAPLPKIEPDSEENNDYFEEVEEMDFNDNSFSSQEENYNAKEFKANFQSNPFAYKNWGGPSFFKLKNRKKAVNSSKTKKQTQKFKKVDFENFNQKDFEIIFEPAKNVHFSEDALNSRTNLIESLPEDNLLTALDLYSFCSIPGFYIKNKTTREISEKLDNSYSPEGNSTPENFTDKQNLINDDEITPMPENSETNKISEILYKKYRRTQKKIDMNRLKDTLYDSVQKSPGDLENVMENLNTYYQKEEMKDISVHFCFISLLHLANEKGLKIENNKENSLKLSLQ